MKKCIICGVPQELSEYYKHSEMSDGHLNKCKTCCKAQAKEREELLRQSSEWVEKEKIRHREKYYRLDYKDKHKPSFEKKKESISKYKGKYPEKYFAKNASGKIKKTKGCHLHHWSYNESDWKDVIELPKEEHYLLHRYIKYDQSVMMYRTLDGHLLNTKQSHLDLLIKIKEIEQI